jgi:hypothetical protein
MLSQYALRIPLTGFALDAIILSLREWDRKSELSCDRAEALVTQNPDTVIHTLMKMTGGSDIEQMDLGEFIKQAEEYANNDSALDSLHKVINTMYMTHPFPVIRVVELINWVRSGEYDRILSGDFQNQEKNHFENVKDTAKTYKESFEKNSTIPVEEMEEMIGKVRQSADDIAKFAKNFFDAFAKR